MRMRYEVDHALRSHISHVIIPECYDPHIDREAQMDVSHGPCLSEVQRRSPSAILVASRSRSRSFTASCSSLVASRRLQMKSDIFSGRVNLDYQGLAHSRIQRKPSVISAGPQNGQPFRALGIEAEGGLGCAAVALSMETCSRLFNWFHWSAICGCFGGPWPSRSITFSEPKHFIDAADVYYYRCDAETLC